MNQVDKKFIKFVIFSLIILLIIFFLGIKLYSLCFSVESNDELEEIISFKDEEFEETKEENTKQVITNEEIEEELNLEDEQEKEEPIEEEIENPTILHTFDNGEEYEIVGYLKIPSLDIEYPILAENSEELLKISITKYWGANPNQVGNLCILGHNYKNSKFFGKLNKIQENEIIEITDTAGKSLNYKVYKTEIIDPEDTSCTSQNTDGKKEITLITCYYENGEKHASKRFVVKASENT